MTLRSIGNWILDTNIFILLAIILIFLLVIGYLWLIYDLLFNSTHYLYDDEKHYNSPDSFEVKKKRLGIASTFIAGLCLIFSTIYFFFTQ
jgi:hypothetical protein